MKHRVVFLVFVMLLLVVNQPLSAETVRMGYFILPPHQYLLDDSAEKPRGAQITSFEAQASLMGYDVEWVGPLPLPRMTEMLKKGEDIDGTVGFPKYSSFEEFLYYPDAPLFFGQPIFVVRQENPLTQIRSIDDIRGYRIGLVKSISGRYTALIDEHRDALTIEELGGDAWIEQNLKKLIAGRLDALFDRQAYTIPFVAAQLQLDTQIKILPIPTPSSPFYVVFSKASQQGKLLLERYNAAVPQVTLNYEDLVQQELEAVTQAE